MAVRALVRELIECCRLMREGPDLNRTRQQVAGRFAVFGGLGELRAVVWLERHVRPVLIKRRDELLENRVVVDH